MAFVCLGGVCPVKLSLFDGGGRMYVTSYVIHPVKLRSTISRGRDVTFKS
jgi:hypothetical protein